MDINNGSDGLSFQNAKDETLLKIKQDGKLGVNCDNPNHEMEVEGTLGIKTRVGVFKKGIVPANGKWHSILSNLDGINIFEIVAVAKGKVKTGHYCVSHAIALSTFGGKFSKSKIKNTAAYYAGYRDKIKYKWEGNIHNYSLQIKTIRDYGEDPDTKQQFTIDYHITSLLEN